MHPQMLRQKPVVRSHVRHRAAERDAPGIEDHHVVGEIERERNRGNQLSGGEQQMLAIARALVGNPSVVLMDEPSEGLAPVIVEELARAVKRLAATEGLTMIVVEQNTRLALDISPRTAVMDRGRIVFDGPSEELKRDPDKLHRLIGVGKG